MPPVLAGVAVAVALLVGALIGYALGLREAGARWSGADKRWLYWLRQHGGRVFWVCDANDPASCAAMRDELEAQLENRETLDAVQRIRRGRL